MLKRSYKNKCHCWLEVLIIVSRTERFQLQNEIITNQRRSCAVMVPPSEDVEWSDNSRSEIWRYPIRISWRSNVPFRNHYETTDKWRTGSHVHCVSCSPLGHTSPSVTTKFVAWGHSLTFKPWRRPHTTYIGNLVKFGYVIGLYAFGFRHSLHIEYKTFRKFYGIAEKNLVQLLVGGLVLW